ncbi:MAG: homocysteine S-methyltransferase family protein [Bacteroidetes bacterium]|nr:homocysteine S-methyltransferase family protein [Bacteroidota bacterium]
MKLLEHIANHKITIADGAMGTELFRAGIAGGEINNLTNPDSVQNIHRSYLNAGARLVTTNTLTMNRIFIESHSLDIDVVKVNEAGAKLARQSAGNDNYVLGDISSTGQLLEPYGEFREESFFHTYKEQAGILAENGIDGFIIETMTDLREALCALRACKIISSLPVFVTISFSTAKNGGKTIMGNSAKDCAISLTEEGADAIGTNCGSIDPKDMPLIISQMRDHSPLPLIAQPNAGKPKLLNNVTTFDMPPDMLANCMTKCIQNGASIIGGCCGTTPDHIKAISVLT